MFTTPELSRTKKVVLGLSMGMGLTACGSVLNSSPVKPSSPEASMAREFNNISGAKVGHIENASYSRKISKVLPDGSQVQVSVTSKAVEGTGADRQLDADQVEDIGITVFAKNAAVGISPAEFSLTLDKENGVWNASYYQYFSTSEPYFLVELSQTSIQVSDRPADMIPTDSVSSSKAITLYKEIVAESNVVINACASMHNLPSFPDIQA